jgi:ribosomal protein S27AE
MKTEMVPVQVIVTMDMAKQSESEVEVQHLTPAERLVVGLKILGIFWLGAILCLPIPMVHFVAVPVGLIAGVVMFFRAYGLTERLKSGSIPCPKCGTSFAADLKPFVWPKHETCPQCGMDLLLKRNS